MRDLLLVVVVCGCALIALRRPAFGMLVYVCFGIINPQGFAWGFGRTFPLAMIMAISTMAGYVFSSETKRFPRQKEVWVLLGLWGLFCVSTGFVVLSPRNWALADPMTRFTHVSKILLMVFLSMSILYKIERVQLLMKVIALSIGFFGLKAGVFSIVTAGSYMVWGPSGSFLYANNAIGLALAMNVPLLYYLIQIEENQWLRHLMWAMLILSYPATICTFSRGAWLGLLVVTGLIILKSRYKAVMLFAAGGVIVVALPMLWMLTLGDVLPERVHDRLDDLVNANEEASAVSRYWNWELCRRVGVENPLKGEGFDFYSPEMYPKYYPEFIEKYGSGKVWSCHSMWLTVLAEHGVIAFALWIVLLISCFLSLRRVEVMSRKYLELAWMGYYAWMLQVSFVAYMVVGTFLDTAYFDVFYQLVAVVILLAEHSYRFHNNRRYVQEDDYNQRMVEKQSFAGVG